jgi:hypothetical protein
LTMMENGVSFFVAPKQVCAEPVHVC